MLHVDHQTALVASAGSDNTVKLWKVGLGSKPLCLQTIGMGRQFAMALSLAKFPLSDTLTYFLAIGGSNHSVLVYATLQAEPDAFRLAFTLQGHENWVRGLSFALFRNAESAQPELLLASASQDKYVRLWKLAQSETGSTRAATATMTREGATGLSVQRQIYQLSSVLAFEATLASLLVGHDGWVYTTHWVPELLSSHDPYRKSYRLVTSSADGLMMIWQLDAADQLWKNTVSEPRAFKDHGIGRG